MTLLMRDQENVEKGVALGLEQGENRVIIRLYNNGFTVEQIADLTGKDADKVKELIKRNA